MSFPAALTDYDRSFLMMRHKVLLLGCLQPETAPPDQTQRTFQGSHIKGMTQYCDCYRTAKPEFQNKVISRFTPPFTSTCGAHILLIFGGQFTLDKDMANDYIELRCGRKLEFHLVMLLAFRVVRHVSGHVFLRHRSAQWVFITPR